MKDRKDFGRVMISDTIYNLLIYLLISSKEEIEDTFFFFSDRVPKSIREQLPHKFMPRNGYPLGGRILVRIFTNFTKLYRWPFLKTAEIFGQDHLFFTSTLTASRGMTIIEDGTANYNIKGGGKLRNKSKFKRFLFGERINQPRFGASSWDKRVILTGIGPTPKEVVGKAEIIDIKALWSGKSPEFKEWLLALYGINNDKLESLRSRKALLLVQSLEVHGVPRDVVIEVYKDMVKGVEPRDLIIKPHPASVIDYSEYFPESYIFNDPIPMELFTFMGIEFEDVYTVSTTAALSMSKRVNVHFAGTSVHPLILKALGRMEYSDFVGRGE